MSAGISLVVLPFAIAIALFMAGHPPRGPARPGFDQAADVVLIVWTLIALPAGILVLRDTVRHRGRLSRDLVEGHAWDFAELSVLPASRILVAPEERRGQPVEVTTAAPRPESFHAVPVELVHAETGEKRQFLQRRLSDDEARELVAHAEEPLWSWWLVWPAIIGTGWIVASLHGERPALGALGATGFAWIGIRLWRSARIRERIRKDAALGVAVVVAATPEMPVESEFLPESQMFWTLAGAPAEWRLSPVRGDPEVISGART